MNYIPIGGWCGTKVALKDSGLFDEPSLPFDSVRVSMEGVIDCIENDFQHFFPKEIKRDFNRFNPFPKQINHIYLVPLRAHDI
jgi:hypothetical protein